MTDKRHGKILVVEDQQGWRNLLTDILNRDGHEVIPATNFQEAKERIDNDRFDLAIIDMRLVDSDSYNIQGMAVLQEVKKQYPDLKVIILTGYPDSAQRIKSIEDYHADDYLEKVPDGKPLDLDQFSQRIHELLETS